MRHLFYSLIIVSVLSLSCSNSGDGSALNNDVALTQTLRTARLFMS